MFIASRETACIAGRFQGCLNRLKRAVRVLRPREHRWFAWIVGCGTEAAARHGAPDHRGRSGEPSHFYFVSA